MGSFGAHGRTAMAENQLTSTSNPLNKLSQHFSIKHLTWWYRWLKTKTPLVLIGAARHTIFRLFRGPLFTGFTAQPTASKHRSTYIRLQQDEYSTHSNQLPYSSGLLCNCMTKYDCIKPVLVFNMAKKGCAQKSHWLYPRQTWSDSDKKRVYCWAVGSHAGKSTCCQRNTLTYSLTRNLTIESRDHSIRIRSSTTLRG